MMMMGDIIMVLSLFLWWLGALSILYVPTVHSCHYLIMFFPVGVFGFCYWVIWVLWLHISPLSDKVCKYFLLIVCFLILMVSFSSFGFLVPVLKPLFLSFWWQFPTKKIIPELVKELPLCFLLEAYSSGFGIQSLIHLINLAIWYKLMVFLDFTGIKEESRMTPQNLVVQVDLDLLLSLTKEQDQSRSSSWGHYKLHGPQKRMTHWFWVQTDGSPHRRVNSHRTSNSGAGLLPSVGLPSRGVNLKTSFINSWLVYLLTCLAALGLGCGGPGSSVVACGF